MRNISDEKIIKITFLFSLFAHCLFLGMPGLNLNTSLVQKPEEDITVEIRIEKHPLLPKIDVMGQEKKLKIEDREQITEDRKEQKHLLEPEPEPEEQVEVINSQEKAMLRYQDMVKQKIESCRRYPNWAKKQGFEGVSYLTFILLSNGRIQDIKIIRSSGFDILDEEAVLTVKRAAPFRPIPEQFNCSNLTMEIALVFQLK